MEGRAQVTTTTESVTTSSGAFTEFGPNSETVVIRSETNPAPLRYVVTKQTTIVDEAGAVLAVEKIPVGSQMVVHYTGTGDRLVASRIVVRNLPVTIAPVTTVPVATERQSATTTTTTTTRNVADDDEGDALEDAREDRKERREDAIDKQKERLDDLKDKIEDEDE